MKSALVACLVLLMLPAANAREANPRQLGPFSLGMTLKQFRKAAAQANFTKPKLQVPQERDIMGLGLMTIQPVVTEARDLKPTAGKIWQATGYMLNDRVIYLNVDYATEDGERLKRWYTEYDVPINAQRALVDRAWTKAGVVLYCDRFGQSLHAIEYEGLRASDRVLLSLQGSITKANEFFRRLHARAAESSLEQIRRRVITAFEKRKDSGGKLMCVPPKTVALTPGDFACDLPEKRFPQASEKWAHETWAYLGVNSATLSRHYSYSIEATGSMESTRITLLAVGDLDCDGTVATIRVTLAADARANQFNCRLSEGEWEVINPFE